MKDRTLKLVTGTEIVDGEQQLVYKSYPYPLFVKGGLVKKAFEIAAEMEKSSQEKIVQNIDKLADCVVELYGKQFTRDELIDGVQAHELLQTLNKVVEFVMTGESSGNGQKNVIQEKKG